MVYIHKLFVSFGILYPWNFLFQMEDCLGVWEYWYRCYHFHHCPCKKCYSQWWSGNFSGVIKANQRPAWLQSVTFYQIFHNRNSKNLHLYFSSFDLWKFFTVHNPDVPLNLYLKNKIAKLKCKFVIIFVFLSKYIYIYIFTWYIIL